MKIHSLLVATSLAAFVSTAPASAQHRTVYEARTEANAQSFAVSESGSAHVINGAVVPGDTYTSPGGTATGGGSVGQSWAQTSEGNLSFGNDASASADLTTGTLRASVESHGPAYFGWPNGFASARFDDTIFFTNTSGSALTIGLTFAFNGSMLDPYAANPGGSASFGLACFSLDCYNGTGDRIVFATGPTRTPQDNWNYYFTYNSSCFGENIFCGQGAAPYFQSGLNQPNAGGIVDGWISTSLIIPTGTSSIGLSASLNLDCRGASSCDFGHTGTFRFDDLPDGLTFSSASGLLLTGLQVPPTGAVPEPATWLMMILGFGLVGAAMRQRPARGAAFA